MRAAVIDVGSNSVRLLLMERMDPGGAVGERTVTVTGLRRGAGAGGRITDAALSRLDACLADYAARIAAAGSPPVAAVGTAAVREAPNRTSIQAIARRRLGADLEVIDGRREAALSFAGARLVLPPSGGLCRMIDIGGGSTEVVAGDADGPRASVSLPLGVNRQGDGITGDPPDPRQVQAVADGARAMVREATREFGSAGPLVGVAGTVTTVAAVMRGGYDPVAIHGMPVGRDDVDGVLTRLARLGEADRARTPGLHPDRVNVIVPGLAILAGAMDALGEKELIVSERDILDGIALSLGG